MFCRCSASSIRTSFKYQKSKSLPPDSTCQQGWLGALSQGSNQPCSSSARCQPARCVNGRSSNVIAARAAIAAPISTHQVVDVNCSNVQELLNHVVQYSSQKISRRAVQNAREQQQQQHSQLHSQQQHAEQQLSQLIPLHVQQQQQQSNQQRHNDMQHGHTQELLHEQEWQELLWRQQHIPRQQQQQQLDHLQLAIASRSGSPINQQSTKQQQQQPAFTPVQDVTCTICGGNPGTAPLLQESPTALPPTEGINRSWSSARCNGMRGWSQPEMLQGWRHSKRDSIARTARGQAMLRLSSNTDTQHVAAQLLSWLQREQQVVLSAAGALLALPALQVIAQTQQQLAEQQPSCQVLVTVQCKTNRRPNGDGRCRVFNIICQLQRLAGQTSLQRRTATWQRKQLRRYQTSAGTLQQQHLVQQRLGQQHQEQPVPQQPSVLQQQQHLQQLPQRDDVLEAVTSGKQMQHLQDPQQRSQPNKSRLWHNGHEPPHLQQNGSDSSTGHTLEQQQQTQQHSGSLLSMHGVPVAASYSHLVGSVASMHQLPQHEHQHSSPLQQGCHTNSLMGSLGVLEQQQQLQRHQQHASAQATMVKEQQHHKQRQQHSRLTQAPPLELFDLGRQANAISQQQQASCSCGGAAAAAVAVQEVAMVGSAIDIAEALDLALLSSAVVCVPVAYSKHGAKLLEAVAMLNRRWQYQQLTARCNSRGKHSNSMAVVNSRDCSASGVGSVWLHDPAAAGLQLVLQLRSGAVPRQSGPKQGLLVYMSTMLIVQ